MRFFRHYFMTAILLSAGLGGTTTAAEQPAYAGFDRNEYPGDAALPELRKHFDFTGYWLTNPPGTAQNTWTGKREILLRYGFGFLVVANGRLDQEILAAGKKGTSAGALGAKDAAATVASARREGFPARAILFLDQEEGGRLLPEQAGYLLAWTEAVVSSGYRAGVYASGQPVSEGRGPDGKPLTITTIEDIRARIRGAHLHGVTFWVAQDACPPAPGCVLRAPEVERSGIAEAEVWQYAQSPRRKSITAACAKTYDANGDCYTPEPARFDVDFNSATSADPSHGR